MADYTGGANRKSCRVMPLAFLLFATVAVPRAQNPAAPQPVVHQLQQQLAWYMDRVAMTGFLVTSVLLFAMAAGCLVLWLNARSFNAFRSVGLYLLMVSGVFFVDYLGLRQWDSFFTTLSSLWLVEMSADVVRISKRGWAIPIRLICAGALVVNWLPRLAWVHQVPVDLSQIAVFVLLLLSFRRLNPKLRLIAAAIAIVWFFRLPLDQDLRLFAYIPYSFEIGGWRWYYGPCAMVLFGATALTIFVRELIQDQREKQRMSTELEAARAVQQVLLGLETPAISGLRIESAYKPAGEVGGDFFQIVPVEKDGVLLVLGDVSGKGLHAAMTVSAIMGALRIVPSSRPAEVLSALNRTLCGRLSGGLVTCSVARIESDGRMTVANAGHLAPYRNGHEVLLEPGLPLGVIEAADYAESVFTLNLGDALTFMSDGVVEARTSAGELFGFDRTRSISTQSAEQIAQAAQAFGQEDDITVLTLTFIGAGVLHA